MKNLILIPLTAVLISLVGCASSDKQSFGSKDVIAEDTLNAQISSLLDPLYDFVIENPLTQGDAAALMFRRNGDILLKERELLRSIGELNAQSLSFLPQLTLSAQNTVRNKLALSTSERYNADGEATDLGEVDTTPSYSSEKESKTTNALLSFDLLNLYKNHLVSRQRGNDMYIAQLQKELASGNAWLDLTAAWYLSGLSQSLEADMSMSLSDMRNTVDNGCLDISLSAIGTDELLADCDESLALIGQFETSINYLKQGNTKLATLLSIDPKRQIPIKVMEFTDPGSFKASASELADIALRQRPELYIEGYNYRNAALDKKRAWSGLFPSIEVGLELKTDNNKFVINQDWDEKYYKVTWNILGSALSASTHAKVAKYNQDTIAQKLTNLAVVTVSQIFSEYDNYHAQRNTWLNSHARLVNSQRQLDRAIKRFEMGDISPLLYKVQSMKHLSKKLKSSADYARMKTAQAQLYLAMGVLVTPLFSPNDSVQVIAGRFDDLIAKLGLL